MYSVSKAAAHVRITLPHLRSPLMRNQHLGRNLAVELGPRNITSNVVAPGFFPSKLASGLIDKLGGTKELEDANPRKRLGEPEDIAGVMVYLCSPAGSYMYAPYSFSLDSTLTCHAEMVLVLWSMVGWCFLREGNRNYEYSPQSNTQYQSFQPSFPPSPPSSGLFSNHL